MNKKIIFPILFFCVFNVAAFCFEPSSDTKIGLTASHGKLSGRVEAQYEILQHSEFLKGMFAHGMLESEQLKNGEDISLDYVLGSIYEDLLLFGVEDFFEPQDLLVAIFAILGLIHKQKVLVLNKLSLGSIVHLLFVGDALQIQELVNATVSVFVENLVENVAKINPGILLRIMRSNLFSFSSSLVKKIVEKNYNLFYPVLLEAEEKLRGKFPITNLSTFNLNRKAITVGRMEHMAKVWDVGEDGGWKFVSNLIGHDEYVRDASFSSEGNKIVTSSWDKTAKVWSLDCDGVWKCDATLEGHVKWVNSAEFNQDGNKIVTASSDDTAMVWSLDCDGVWKCEATLEGHNDSLWSAEFSLDGTKIVTAPSDNTATVWGVDEDGFWSCIATLVGHKDTVKSVNFNLDGTKIVTASNDTTAKVWSVDEYGAWECVATLKGHSDYLRSAKFSNDGKKIVTSSYDGTVKVWCVGEDGVWNCFATSKKHGSFIKSAKFILDGNKIVTVSGSGKAMIWDLNKPVLLGQALFVVLAKENPEYFKNLDGEAFDVLSDVWQSFDSQVQQTLRNNFPEINLDRFELVDGIQNIKYRMSSCCL